MTLRAERYKVSTPFFPLRPAAALLLAALASSAQAQTLPPRSQWQASSSSQQVPAMAISHLIDGTKMKDYPVTDEIRWHSKIPHIGKLVWDQFHSIF